MVFQKYIIGNKDDSFSDDMDVAGVQSANDALNHKMNLDSAPQQLKENIFMGSSRMSPSKRSGRGKSPSKFALSL